MKVAMISEHASPLAVLGGVDAGGQNVHVASLATALARHGAKVTVFTRRDSPDLKRRVDFVPGVVVEHLDAGPACAVPKDELWQHMPQFAAGVTRSLSADLPDVLHSHFWMSGAAAVWTAEKLGVPVVHTFHALGIVKRRHQGSADTSPPERISLERNLLGRFDHVIATCSDEVFELARMGADLRRIAVVPCGVDLSVFRPDGPAEQRPNGRQRLLVVSRMVPRKGIGNAIDALAELRGAELVIAGGPPRSALGDDPEGRRLLELAARRQVSDRVQFRGQIDREAVPALLRSADAVLCVPWYEPFGIVPLEAMACGVPVVAASVGGLVDTVVHEQTGLHVPPRDPHAIAAAAGRLLADPALAQSLGDAGASRARERYGWDAVAAATLRVYVDVMARACQDQGRAVARGGRAR
ncbi:MAG: glycosyltransferase [Gaiellales bacterium]